MRSGTCYTYDALGRALTATHADGSVDTLTYSGNMATHADAFGASTQQTVDALGRITSVVEDSTGLNYSTTYTYDALDDLTGVTQAGLATNLCSTGQSRCFTYDSLKELVSATNPESGTTTYTYDANGNLSTKVSGTVTTNYTYDSLDRVHFRSYQLASGSPVAPTPSVTWCYDGIATQDGLCAAPSVAVTNASGRLTQVSNSVSATSILGYDPLGRILGSTQTTNGTNPFLFTYVYNLAGEVMSTAYPSGRTVVNAYDSAGRLYGVSGTTPDQQMTTYASTVLYTPQGSLGSLARGDQQAETWTYNNRLQAQSIAVGSVFSAAMSYCQGGGTGCTTNNGNIWQIGLGTLNIAPNVTQTFNYDKVNRLLSIQEGSLSGRRGFTITGATGG